MSSSDSNEEEYLLTYNKAIENINDHNLLSKLLLDLPDDYELKFMKRAAKINNKDLALFILSRSSVEDYEKELLIILFNKAAKLGNYEMCMFVLGYSSENELDLTFYSDSLDAALKGGDKRIVDLVFSRLRLDLDIWSKAPGCIKNTIKLSDKIGGGYTERILLLLKSVNEKRYYKIVSSQV